MLPYYYYEMSALTPSFYSTWKKIICIKMHVVHFFSVKNHRKYIESILSMENQIQ